MEVLTAPGARGRLHFHFYGPQSPLFAKTWKLPDLEEVQNRTRFTEGTRGCAPWCNG